MIRGLFYAGLVAFAALAVFFKIGVIKDKRNAPTISIANEHKLHGKPVEVATVQKGELKFFERASGNFANSGVVLYVSKLQWNKMASGQDALVLGSGNKPLKAKVAWKAKAADTETGLYRIDVALLERALFEKGQNVVVDINTRTLKNVKAVPAASLESEGTSSHVWVLEENKAVKRKVETGERSQMRVRVLSGLKAGEKVIVRGASSLEKGDIARIVSAGEEK